MLYKINLNDKVKVKLTDYGKQILGEYYQERYENMYSLTRRAYILDYILSQLNKEIQEFELWELMQIFGNEMYDGNPYPCFVDGNLRQCFVNNEIIIEYEEN